MKRMEVKIERKPEKKWLWVMKCVDLELSEEKKRGKENWKENIKDNFKFN